MLDDELIKQRSTKIELELKQIESSSVDLANDKKHPESLDGFSQISIVQFIDKISFGLLYLPKTGSLITELCPLK